MVDIFLRYLENTVQKYNSMKFAHLFLFIYILIGWPP